MENKNQVTFKPVIKNIGRFENIRLATGVILDDKPKKFRANYTTSNFTGISTKEYGKYWFNINGKKAIFKSFDTLKATKPARIVNELLCAELAKQVGVECAQCESATIDNKNGIISYNVANKNEEMVSARDFKLYMGVLDLNHSFVSYSKILRLYKECGYKFNLADEMLKLYKVVVFDMLTFQTDRHAGNLFFLINENKSTIRLSPIFDNELSFLALYLTRMNLFEDNVDFRVAKKYFCNGTHLLSIKTINNKKVKYEQNKKDIITVANKHPYFKQGLQDMLENINIKKAIRNVEKMGVHIPQSYKDYVTMIVESVKQDLEKSLYAEDTQNIEK